MSGMLWGMTSTSGADDRLRALMSPERALMAAIGVLLVVGGMTTSGFASVDNLQAILASVGILGIVSVGMTCITLSGNLFSLTLGATLTVTSMSFLALTDLGLVVAIALSVALGIAVCAVQGLLVGIAGANPIVVTIGAGSLQLGVASKLTDGATVYPDGDHYKTLAGKIADIPISVFVLIALVLLVEAWLRLSRRGHELRLVGENRSAAHAGALRVTGATVAAFTIAGACAGIGGILQGAASANATLLSGSDNFTFNAIAVVLIGGVAAAGGRGSPLRVVLAVVVVAAISDMALLRGYGTGVQTAITGLFVLAAVVALRQRGATTS